jgi:hypothetical protein
MEETRNDADLVNAVHTLLTMNSLLMQPAGTGHLCNCRAMVAGQHSATKL